MRNTLLTKLILLLLFLSSCESDKLDVDIAGIKLNVEVKRMDQELFGQSSDKVIQNIDQLKVGYGSFFKRFTQNIINIGSPDDPNFSNSLTNFIEDPTVKEVYSKTASQFKDFSKYKGELTEAFKRYHYYFPEKTVPLVVTYISGFNYAVVTEDSVIAIALEMYLGKNCEYYKMLTYPNYRVQNMNDWNLVPDALKAWLSTEFEPDNMKNELLSHMIHNGKIMYLMDATFPSMEDTLKMGYSKDQLEWCFANESNIWKHFIEKKLFYSTDHSENTKYLGEGPFTSGLPRESPSRIGIWLGWEIVRAYMKNNPDVTIPELMKEMDYQKILNKSKYKPRR